jgi:uncharacterized Ntn-hydrolase superfamily protein
MTERRFLETEGRPLAERLPEALVAGEAAGGDSRGRPSAALHDLAVILEANRKSDEALGVVGRAIELNPKLRGQAEKDDDLAALRSRLPE